MLRLQNAQLKHKTKLLNERENQGSKVSTLIFNLLQEAKAKYEKTSKEVFDRFKDQDKMQQEHIFIIQEQYNKIQEIYNQKMAQLKERSERDGVK